ncbi:MAG: hypothetical protein IAE98_04740 [Candidatus Kapabacteria bacterium]|nr:hypothetical protein [Candidatus Kapabacteria bacterium]
MNSVKFTSILLAIFLIILLVSCSNKIYKYPEGNLNNNRPNANKEVSEVAPVQNSSEYDICGAFDREHSNNDFSELSVSPSSAFIKTMFPVSNFNKDMVDYLTKNIESIVFTGMDKGFAAFAHPISYDLAKNLNLPFSPESKNVGGADLFEFYKNREGKFEFKILDSPINSIFWDSHPTAITDTMPDGSCVTLLLWSSDRNAPFAERISLSGKKFPGGNADLFYAFRFADGTWTEVKTLAQNINTESNEGTPFIYCSCCKPYLLFSSDRLKSKAGDFDIFYTKLAIDYKKFEIKVLDDAQLLGEKANESRSDINTINSFSDDRFPLVPLPHGLSSPDLIYFSSNRYDSKLDKQMKIGGTIIANAGSYDIYRLPLPEFMNCPAPEPPTVKMNVALINLANPDEPVRMPVISLFDNNGNEIESRDLSQAEFEIKGGKQYFIKGGSHFNLLDCDSEPVKVLSGYLIPSDTIVVIGREIATEKRIVSALTSGLADFEKLHKIQYDTSYSELIVFGRKLKVQHAQTVLITNPRLAGAMMEYDQEITIVSSYDKLRRQTPKTASQASNARLSGAGANSEVSKNGGWNISPRTGDNLVFYDTVYVLPEYFVKPPCYCEFTEFMTGYEQNVPYYQTGFWEVNTLSNFRRDMNKLGRREFSEAKWVELHRNNQYFTNSPERRQSRIYEYEKFAKIVDKNLDMMADIINRRIIPAFSIIDSISGNEKLIISLDAWSDKRPVRRGWYIGDEVEYYEGVLHESVSHYDVTFKKVSIQSGDLLNLNNDTLSKLRAYYGYHELITRLLDTKKFGSAFYDYFEQGKVLLPDNRALGSNVSNVGAFDPQSRIENAKIIFLIKGNYFDPTEFKIPKYIRNVDSSLYMLDTIRRIDLRINNLYYLAGKLVESPCCNKALPCLDYEMILNASNRNPEKTNTSSNQAIPKQNERYLLYFGSYNDINVAQLIMVMLNEITDTELIIEQYESDGEQKYIVRTKSSFYADEARSKQDSFIRRSNIRSEDYPSFVVELIQSE